MMPSSKDWLRHFRIANQNISITAHHHTYAAYIEHLSDFMRLFKTLPTSVLIF